MSYVECVEAQWVIGGTVNALNMTPAEWRHLQETYTVGELLMPCCKGAAVPKVSPNGHFHFAHASGACSESEESQWHLAAKSVVRATLETLGCVATVEEPGKGATGRWQADVWGERGEVRIAVEIQRSYQHLRDYRDRQEKYRQSGVRCIWLLRQDRLLTLFKSMRKARLTQDFAGGSLPISDGGFLPDVPVAALVIEKTGETQIQGGWALQATLGEVLEAVMTDRFRWHAGWWTLNAEEVMEEQLRLDRERLAASMAAVKKRRRR